ncbi:MAG: YqaE/Pmp3 family membrane protein [Chloroflexota bacterium]|nr:YqaE/Pmp3 family membrane protein [Chloroflexota bacterium]
MKYLIAILLPPLGMLLAGRPLMALICLILMITLIGWPIAAIWALLVVNSAETEARMRRMLRDRR